MDFYIIIHTILTLMMEVIITTALILSLEIRSKALFFAIRITEIAITKPLMMLGMIGTAGRIALVIPFDLCLPILMSSGGFRMRVTRTVVLYLGVIFTELVGTSIYGVITGGAESPTAIGPDNFANQVLIYLILLFVAIGINGLIITAFRRFDGLDTSSSLPTVGLLLSTFLPHMIIYGRFLSYSGNDPRQYVFVVAYCWLVFIGSCVILAIAGREAASRREAAEAALVARKTKHTLDEVKALAIRAEGMNSLRHALANDVRTVHRLAGMGDIEEADRHLMNLQEKARVLNGRRNG